jgi:hypothetical protein
MQESLAVALFAFSVGLTISVDIFFYTLAKASVEKLDWRNWTVPAATAHVVLMGIVVGMFYILGHSFQFLRLPLGLLGALIIGRYLYELTNEWRSVETKWSLTKTLEDRFGQSWLLSWLKASVLAVSWDCIPVAAGITAETDTWMRLQLAGGLLVIGVTVAVATQASLIVNRMIRQQVGKVTDTTKVAGLLLGNWLVLCLLGGFFFLALGKSIAPWLSSVEDLEIYHALPLSAFLSTVFFAIHWHALWIEQANSVD